MQLLLRLMRRSLHKRERRQGCSSNKSNECMVKMQLLLRLMRRSLHKRTIQVLARMN